MGVHIGGNAPTVILNSDRTIGIEVDFNVATVTCQRLIDRVIHHLVH